MTDDSPVSSPLARAAAPSGRAALGWDPWLGPSVEAPRALTCPVPCLVQSYLLMATVIFLPYVSKAAGWCRARLVGRCQAGLEWGAQSTGQAGGVPAGPPSWPEALRAWPPLPQAPGSPRLAAWRSSPSTCTSRSARSGWRPSATGSTPLWPRCSSWTSGEDPPGRDSSASPTKAPRSPGPPSPRGSHLRTHLRRTRSASFPGLPTQGGQPPAPHVHLLPRARLFPSLLPFCLAGRPLQSVTVPAFVAVILFLSVLSAAFSSLPSFF